MDILLIIAGPVVAILIVEIIGFAMFRGRKVSNRQGWGSAGGFSAAMGIMVARDDRKLLGLAGFLKDAGFGSGFANLTSDLIYLSLAFAFSYLVWVALSKIFSRKVISLD